MKKLNKKGFTLIELLVVIAIIGLLSTMAVIALGNARAKARDAKRQSDLKILQTAIELYMSDNEAPPALLAVGGINTWALLATELSEFLPGGLPEDPTTRTWCYCENGDNYLVATTLEDDTKSIAGELDSVAADITAAYNPVTSLDNCLCSDSAAPAALDCRDTGLGTVDADASQTTVCLGSI